jgi:serine/threonine-protein kinase
VAILRGVCEAVEAAHRRLLVHRDLKPDNIFLVRAETGEIPKVLDFGIAKFLPTDTHATADTGTGQLVGTIAYMSPEQWLGQPVDAAWDLWALAIVAYEMLTGAQPFAGGVTPADWQVALLAGRFTPVARHLPEAPAQWQEFFARAFALERERRPGSARVFFSALEQALG